MASHLYIRAARARAPSSPPLTLQNPAPLPQQRTNPMLDEEMSRHIQTILENADEETLRSYAHGWLETIANESPAMFAEEVEKCIPDTEED